MISCVEMNERRRIRVVRQETMKGGKFGSNLMMRKFTMPKYQWGGDPLSCDKLPAQSICGMKCLQVGF